MEAHLLLLGSSDCLLNKLVNKKALATAAELALGVPGPGKRSRRGWRTQRGSTRLGWAEKARHPVGSAPPWELGALRVTALVSKAPPLTLLLTSHMQIYLPFWKRFYILGKFCVPGF